MKTNQNVQYAELTPAAFRQRLAEAPIAYLPLGTLEWHGEHLPLGADGLQSSGFFSELARRAGGIVLPMLFLGPDLSQTRGERAFYGMDVVGMRGGPPEQLDGSAYWIEDDLFGALLERILKNLARAGFKIVVAHGHGPSTKYFRDHSAEWSKRLGLKLFHCWSEQVSSELGVQTDHAAANETSLSMAIFPDLVHMEYLPGDPNEWPKAIGGKDPRQYASPETGQEIIRVNVAWLEAALRQALSSPTDVSTIES